MPVLDGPSAAPTRQSHGFTYRNAIITLPGGTRLSANDQSPRPPRGFGATELRPFPDDDGWVSPRQPVLESNGAPHEFYFTRAAYGGLPNQGYASWTIDFPKADRQFMVGIERLIDRLDAYRYENPLLLTDSELSRYPFLYFVEPGHLALSEEEIKALRRYLLTGGFAVFDDFWGSYEWANLEKELARLFPEYPIVDLDLDHPVFHCFYDVDKIVQVPNVGNGRAVGNGVPGAHTWEQDGFVPKVRGIFDDHKRLMVVINWNTDLGDAWEWAEAPDYPLEFSTYAYKMGVNFIVYAMTH